MNDFLSTISTALTLLASCQCQAAEVAAAASADAVLGEDPKSFGINSCLKSKSWYHEMNLALGSDTMDLDSLTMKSTCYNSIFRGCTTPVIHLFSAIYRGPMSLHSTRSPRGPPCVSTVGQSWFCSDELNPITMKSPPKQWQIYRSL